MKRVRETQTKVTKDFLESVLDQNVEPNFRPKHPCACCKIAKLLNNDLIQDTKLRMAREAGKDNIPLRNMETQDPDQSRPQKPDGKIPSDWSDSDEGKDDQASAKPLDIQEPQSSTSFVNEPLRQPNTYPKVLNLGRGRGMTLLANWTNENNGCGHGISIPQASKESEIAVVPPTPTHKIVYTERVQTFDEIPAPVRPRHPLANWTSVRLGDNPNRPTVDEITQGQQQWNMFNDNAHGQNYNRPSDETESVEGDPIYTGDDDSTSGLGLEDVK